MRYIKIASALLLAAFPYLTGFADRCFLRSKLPISVILIIQFIIFGAWIALCIICNISSLWKTSDIILAGRNMFIKLVYLPAHFYLRYLFLGMLNPWTFMVSWVPILLSIILLSVSGAANITACLNLRRHRKCGTVAALFLGIGSFIIIADFFSAMIQIFISVRKVKEQTNGNRQK